MKTHRIALTFILTVVSILSSAISSLGADATFSWIPNDEPVSGYCIHYGTSSGNYTSIIDALLPAEVDGRIIYTVTGLTAGETYYFAATAYTDTEESGFSTEVVYSVPVTDPGTDPIDAPIANDISLEGNEDTASTGQLEIEDGSDPADNFSISSQPIHGTITLEESSGNFTYTPNPDYFGSDTFTYTASNSAGTSSGATVSINIAPVNDLPIASNGSFSVNGNSSYTGTLSATDIDQDSLSYSLNSQGTNGIASINQDGTFYYVPFPYVSGSDEFTFTVNDGTGDSNIATVNVTITPVSATTGFDFNTLNFSTYSNQGGSGDISSEDEGATLLIEGNNWVQTDSTYNITANTVIAFDFYSTTEGEIQGIGFDEDDDLTNDKRIFQLFGSQIWSNAIQVSPKYTNSDLGTWVHYSIPVGQYYTGNNMYLVLVNDHDLLPRDANSRFSNIVISDGTSLDHFPSITIGAPAINALYTLGDEVTLTGTASDIEDGNLNTTIEWTSSLSGSLGVGSTVSTTTLPGGFHTITASVTDSAGNTVSNTVSITVTSNTASLDIDSLTFSTYSIQGGSGVVSSQDGGTTLHIEGNNWIKTDSTYTISADTVLEFDFNSTIKGEIHGIGFDEDDVLTNDSRIYQLAGTQTWSKAIQVSPQYTTSDLGTWVHYTIPIGQYYTGSDMNLVFVNDHDILPRNGDSLFRNIKVHQ